MLSCDISTCIDHVNYPTITCYLILSNDNDFKINAKRSVRDTPLNNLIREVYVYSLVILKVHNFLDGRVVTTYSYLTFFERQVFAVHQGYHFEDTVRTSPSLLNYCFTPHILADPFDFISTYSDNKAL